LLQSQLWLLVCVACLLGLLVGSFLNVVIHRLPLMMEREWQAQCAELSGGSVEETEPLNLSTPRSRCPNCGHAISAVENIPIVSYLFLKGKCAECKSPISARYPIIELVTGILSGLIAWQYGFDWSCLGALALVWALIALTMIDVDHQLLPDSITLPLVWLGILFNLFGVFTDLNSSVIGAMAGYLSLWSVYHLFKLLTGKEGMGYGDFKLLAALGAWLGWQYILMIILLSSLVGAIVGISLIIFRKHNSQVPIPFGPYLAAAGGIALIWGPSINQAYLNWLGLH
jgi:leader peptidase (prepilin peptidase)/N-methyltransferase